jgi:Fic family protein
VREVANYYKGLQLMEKWVNAQQPITEKKCQMLHSALFYGKANQASPYRDGQNVIKDSNGTIVYLPPEAQDVPRLMQELFSWITSSSEHFPIPIIAAVAHYQFETIHPYFDGNGRTGRMLTTWILFQGGYDLGRFYALEEFYANDLTGYYDALVTHPHHNYYFGRNTAPITNWIEYFLNGMAHVFDEVEQQVRARIHRETNPEILQALRELNVQQRKVLTLFITQKNVTVKDIANILSLAERYTRDLVNEWVVSGFLFQTDLDGRKRNRHYGLLPTYQILLEQDL